MGRSNRRHIRPGYNSCLNCDRDLPNDEFKVVRHQCKDGTVTEHPYSYCRRCSSEMTCADAKAQRRATPASWRSRRRTVERKSYRRTERLTRAENRKWRAMMAQSAINRLRSAGWSLRRISSAAGVNRDALSRWSRGKSVPWDKHVDALRLLARSLDESDRGKVAV